MWIGGILLFQTGCSLQTEPFFYGCLDPNVNQDKKLKYVNNRYRFSLEYPENYKIYELPNAYGMYLRPKNQPVWEKVVISVLVISHKRTLPPFSDSHDVERVVWEKELSGEPMQKRLIDNTDLGGLVEVIIEREDYTIQLIYNAPDKPLNYGDFDRLVDSLKIW